MSVQRIKKNDVVIAMAGVSAGKTGKVLQVLPSKGRVIVEGLRMIKKCLRKTRDNPKGGIVEKEGSIAISSLMLHCPTCKKGARISHVEEEGKSIRKCKACGHPFDA